ncbi:hypothetical protein GT037_001241 [Alternaria burnsii]|uniref:Uncharacterized protein n=1 Tax=Alternaria burnsii TaxID=1187904 RepID=A0A8H7BDH2_9PLEO|nr:uncharacterized protein GT037_001241 [Alternaria burnsii]KAF7682265.1 hypothetical protein GT037_001241 [Alternaria burnsii]
MTYADEDDIDWSDGSLDEKVIDTFARATQPSPYAETQNDQGSLLVSEVRDQHRRSCSLPLESVSANGSSTAQDPSRVQRAGIGVHLNQRLPSKEDYVNYVLYQANQKAYEATFLNTFVAHALHPNRIAQCSEDPTGSIPTVVEYMESVIREVDSITRRMIWNAHCRTVHLLAKDGKDGAPFLDIDALDAKPFSDYGPSNLFPMAKRMDASWHRTTPSPLMVQYSTKEYELGYQASPLEEIDDFNNTLFRRINIGGVLPTGRAVRLSTSGKREGQNMPGAAIREDRTNSPGSSRLPFAPLESISGSRVSQPSADTPVTIIHQADLDSARQESEASVSPAHAHGRLSYSSPSHLKTPFGHCDVETSNSDNAMQSIEYTEKVNPWRTRLVNDHKRRLTRKWGSPPQAIDCAVQSFKQAVTTAISMGIHPVVHSYPKEIEPITTSKQHQKYVRRSYQSRNKGGSESTEGAAPKTHVSRTRLTGSTAALSEPIPDQLASTELPRTAPLARSKKRRRRNIAAIEQVPAMSSTENWKTASKSCRGSTLHSNDETSSTGQSPYPGLQKSRTLESHQHLPPNAYFKPILRDEKFAWRCAFKHAMGHYYNAGDRKSCRGCNTALSDNVRVVLMDFYMPPRTFYFQPAQGMRWKPSKQLSQPRKCGFSSHDAVAKDAYWKAINYGASEEEAQKRGIDAVVEHIKPKPLPKAPTPEPTPESEPDLGPHPSGSTTMEHGQDIPDGYYWEKRELDEEHAWRCDVNHGLGRYYLAGDRKTCPGCGSSQKGLGKNEEMDFYLPSGVIVRQEAPGLSKFKPRKPYRLSKSTTTRREPITHNQMCANVYFSFVANGYEAEEALRLAVERVDSELDKKQESKMKRHDKQGGSQGQEALGKSGTSSGATRKDSVNTSEVDRTKTKCRRNSRGGCTMALVPKKRSANELSEGETYGVAVGQEVGYTSSEQDPRDSFEVSSTEEESSASESE